MLLKTYLVIYVTDTTDGPLSLSKTMRKTLVGLDYDDIYSLAATIDGLDPDLVAEILIIDEHLNVEHVDWNNVWGKVRK